MIKKQRSVWYLAEREEAQRVVKEGFPPEPEKVRCLVRQHEVWEKTSGENTPWAVKITFKKGTYLPVNPKVDVAAGIPVHYLNEGKRKIELKILGARVTEVTRVGGTTIGDICNWKHCTADSTDWLAASDSFIQELERRGVLKADHPKTLSWCKAHGKAVFDIRMEWMKAKRVTSP